VARRNIRYHGRSTRAVATNIERWYLERSPRGSLAEAGWTLEFAVVV